MNSLQDEEMIKKLYEASEAGVKVKLIIRGICSLISNEIGLSENIEAISIVDRFLEHARVFVFHNGGKKQVLCSSADWMTRNLSYRVETVFPIYDKEVKKQILDMLDLQWKDNVKARILDKQMLNRYNIDINEKEKVQSQVATWEYFKQLNT